MNNHLKIEISDVFKSNSSKKEVILMQGLVFWIAGIEEGGVKRNSIFVRPFKKENSVPQNLIGNNFYLNSSFHGYGGKSYQCIENNEKIYLIWFDQISQSLWLKIFEKPNENDINNCQYLLSNQSTLKLTNRLKGNIDSNFAIISGKFLIGIVEENQKDHLFSIEITKENQSLLILKTFQSFAGGLSSFSGSNIISFIEWHSDNMPWQENNLVLISFNNLGEIKRQEIFDKKLISQSDNLSFFQPLWIDQYSLVCSEDSSGWWNLFIIEISNSLVIKIKKRFIKTNYEYGVTQWISGLSLFSGTSKDFYCLVKYENNWIIEHYQNCCFSKCIKLPFTYLSDLHVDNEKLILRAASSTTFERLVELDLSNLSRQLEDIHEKYFWKSHICSKAESFWFKGYKNRPTHSWIYRPINKSFNLPPLMLKAHSGPTSHFTGNLSSELQFWSSRGWLVAEVNYGGSSGFGRAYRERLDGDWGICDSKDCMNLALELIKLKLVAPSKIVITGNSAGGLTAINTLSNQNLFKAAICKYPVIDLNNMREKTHRFEKNYLNSLVGTFSQNSKNYFLRSPINNISSINHPLLLFHGKKDLVISYLNSLEIHKKLVMKNIPAEIKIFENEGHGFKDKNNKMDVLKTSEIFLNRVFCN